MVQVLPLVTQTTQQRPKLLRALHGYPNFLNPPLVIRLDLNDPPTAVGGIRIRHPFDLCRSNLNQPPTAVGGISDFLCKAVRDRSTTGL